jgi:urea transport system ATP-binding protein
VIIRLNRARGIPTPLLKAGDEARDEVREGIIKIKNQLGVTILLVEQKLPFARKVADRFCIMDRGRSVAVGAMDKLTEDLVKRYLTV